MFINPIEILRLNEISPFEIDNFLIKKAKKLLFADLDLSENGFYDYHGYNLTKTDCERSIDELNNTNSVKYFSFLCSKEMLNNYLINGDVGFFENFEYEEIYSNPDFIELINPHFANRFGNSLLKAFKHEDSLMIKRIFNTEKLIGQQDLNDAYKSLSNEIQNRVDEYCCIIDRIREKTFDNYDESYEGIVSKTKKYFPYELLNLLPAFFQSQINKIAFLINKMQLTIWNEYNLTFVPMQLLEYLLKLKIESIHKTVFEKNYEMVKNAYINEIEQKRNEPIITKWAKYLVDLRNTSQDVENEVINCKSAINKVINLFSVKELNMLPEYADEIRNQIAFSLRDLSIIGFNKNLDIKSSMIIIDLALSIRISDSLKSLITKDKENLIQIEKDAKGVLICYFCENNVPENDSGFKKTLYKVISRSNFIRKSVQYSYGDVFIPRCNSCKDIHSIGNIIRNISTAVFALIGIIIGLITKDKSFLFIGLAGLFVGYLIGLLLRKIYFNLHNIKGDSDNILSLHPLLINKIKEGWSLSKPNP